MNEKQAIDLLLAAWALVFAICVIGIALLPPYSGASKILFVVCSGALTMLAVYLYKAIKVRVP